MSAKPSASNSLRANNRDVGPSNSVVASGLGSFPGASRIKLHSADACKPKNEHRWIERLAREHGRGILGMLWRILGKEQDVLDAYQDCFCKLAGMKRQDEVANDRAYAYRTASNVAVEMLRVRKRRAPHWEAIAADRRSAEAQLEPSVAGTNREALRDAIAELPNHLRNVVILRDLSRFSYDEVGASLGITPATARVYRRHAVIRLAELMAHDEANL